jgi:hypothetical protein
LERTAGIHGFKLFGELKSCEQCAISKARQKNINKEWKGSSQIPVERLYIDISSIKNASYGGSKFWAIVVDNYTDYCWSISLKSKGELKDKMRILLTDFKIAGIEVKYIRCDDSGKNKAFYNHYCLNGELIKFEFSGPRLHREMVKLRGNSRLFTVKSAHLEKWEWLQLKSDIQGKLTNRGTTCMFVGYSVYHSNDVY